VIAPATIRPSHGPDLDHMATLESIADKAIMRANDSGVWPAPVAVIRMAISEDAIAATAERYRAAGWIVAVTAYGRTYFTIDHPERVR
jgi:hypothetical protein